MADQKLLYTIEGNADGLKKAMAESEAAHRRLTDALTRKGVESGALKAMEADLKKIEAAAAETKRQMDFFRRSAEIAPGGIKVFSKDIDKAGKDLAKLTQQSLALRAKLATQSGAADAAGTGVTTAQEQLANAQAKQRVALLEAERQTRVQYGNQVLASLRAQAVETERVAAIEQRRAADEAAASRAAAANARVRASAQQAAAQAAQASLRLQSFATSLPRFDLKGNVAAKLAEVNAAAAKSKLAFDNALAAARNFGSGGASAAQGVSGQLKSLVLQALAVGSAIKGVSATLDAGIKTQQLESKFQFSTGSAEAAAKELAFVRAEADRLAVPLLEAANGYSKLSAATQGTSVAGEQTRKIFTGVASAARALNLESYQVDRAFLAITQALSKGTLQAEEIRGQLAESIPGAFRILANALGVTEQKLNKDLKGGLIDSKTAMVAFAKELERLSQGALPVATQSFQAQAVRLSNSWFDFKAQLAASGVLDAVGEQVTALTAKLAEMSASGELQDFAKNLAQVMGDLARILGTVTRLAIENRDAIGALAAVYAGFKVAKAVQGMAAFVSATAGATGAITGVASGLRILLALLGGPVGIGVALATAAAAWLIFRKSASDTLDEITGKAQKTRQALNDSILNFNAGGLAGDAAIAQAAADAARLAKELKAAKDARAELAKQTNSLEKLDAADTGIAQLQADLERAGRFYGEAVKAKAAADKAKAAADKASVAKPEKAAATASRLPDLRAEFSAELDLAKSALEDQAKVLETALAGQLVSVRQYWAAKRGITEQQLGLEQRTLEKQLADQEDLIRRLSSFKVRDAGSATGAGQGNSETTLANQREALASKLLAARNKAAELRVQLDALNGKKITTDFELKVNTDKALRDIDDAVALARDELARLTGTETDAQRRTAVAVGFRDLLSKVGDDVASIDLINKLIDVKAASANLDTLQARWQLALEAMRNAERSADVQQKQGLITTLGAQNQIAAAHRATAAELEKLLPLMEKAANAIGPEAVAKVAAWKNELASVKTVVDPVAESINTGLRDAFGRVFEDIGSGVRTAKDALLDFARSLVSVINKAASQQLGESLFNALGGGGASGGVGGFFSRLMGTAPLGGKKDGSTPASAIYVQDVGAGGLAGTAGGTDGGGIFSGLGNMLSSLFASIKSAFSSLVSGLGNALSGLFGGGGGGGGQNWIGAIASLFGYAEGGWTGPGAKYQPAGIVHADEFVFDKVATNRIGVGVLENMRRLASGRFVSSRPRSGYADGGLVNLPGAAAPTVNSSTRIINHFDLDSAMSDYLKTRSGERAILNIIQRNPGAVGV